ncbi:MAG: putative Nudix hydrolase NudL [Candidatus Heimdallarchaeota archaeon LC_2]|nr:MAG: putative Nudix hydrolase NudL [Candidatus Heimdallarchaeota archaeon LC_2]
MLSSWNEFQKQIHSDNLLFSRIKNQIESSLTNREEKIVDRNEISEQITEASVLLPLIVSKKLWEDDVSDGLITDHIFLLLEKRSSKMTKNPGDMAFAGGKLDKNDSNLMETAYREAYEEVGIEKNELQFISYMDEFVSTSKYIVRPVVSWLLTNHSGDGMREAIENEYRPKTSETENTVIIPLSHLLNPLNYSNLKFDLNSNITSNRFGYIRYFDIDKYLPKTKIWGLTASMIRRFIDITLPNNTLPYEAVLEE